MSLNFISIYFRSPTAKPDPKRDKVLMEEARSMMAEIFPSLESELLLFVSAYEKLDSFFTMNALVRLSKHVLSAQDTGSFLAISLGTVLVQVRIRLKDYKVYLLSVIVKFFSDKRLSK
jgi:hypothetical protein